MPRYVIHVGILVFHFTFKDRSFHEMKFFSFCTKWAKRNEKKHTLNAAMYD